MLEPAPPHESGGGHIDRLRRTAAALGCSPAEVVALAVLVAAALATLGLLATLAGDDPGDAPLAGLEVLDQEVVVHVSGEVSTPGIYRLPAGARVADALEAAGGSLRDADLASLNLARVLGDGEQLVVGPAHDHSDAAGQQGAWRADGRLDLNLATAADLEQLPGVGPVTAQRILDARERLGRFSSVGDLRTVPGIGEKRLQAIVDLVDA